jgi:type I restriction enzyme, S subunit
MEVREASGIYAHLSVPPACQALPGYKHTEVGLIPEEWSSPKIESLVDEISMGPFGSDIKVSNFISSGVPVLSGANVATERLKDSFVNFVSYEKSKSLKKAVARRGDVVVTHRGTIGQISYIPGDSAFDRYVVSQSQFRVRFTSEAVIPAWVVLYFHSERGAKRLLDGKGHTGVPAISSPTKTFRNLCIPLPPIIEQKAIAQTLGDADALIESLEQLIAKKRQIKQGTMQALLTGKQRLPGFGGNWNTVRLGELANVKTGSRNNQDKVADGLYPFYVRSDTVERINSFSHDCEAILVPGEGRIGEIFHYINGRFDVHQRVYAITQFVADVSARYIHLYMTAHFGRHAMENSVKATVDSLRLPNFQEFEVRLPPSIEEQVAIATVLTDMDTELTELETRLAKTRQLKQGMVQELLTGSIRLV